MDKKFTERTNLNLSEINKDVLKDWEREDLFHRSITEREGQPSFVFFEGPPSANGHPGIHHVMARSIKDTFCRYKTMQGFQVKRKAGWDTHGLPVELNVEKSLGITKEDIGKTISVKKYNDTCRKEVMKFTSEWTDLTKKMGYWVDLEHPYITYQNSYIESLWWLIKQFYDKGLLYKGYTIQPYSPAAGTGLSSHELNQPGCYRDVKDTTVTAQFKLKPESLNDNQSDFCATLRDKAAKGEELYFLAWTTTPWTLPSNTALCVGPKIDYVAIRCFNPYNAKPAIIIMGQPLVAAYFDAKGENGDMSAYKKGDKVMPYEIIAHCTGKDLLGLEYEQLIPWANPGKGAFRVIAGDYVTTEDGTGIVHIAPTFGADDAFVAKKASVPGMTFKTIKGETRPMVDMTGKFFRLEDLDPTFVKDSIDVEKYKEYAGRFVKNDYDPTLTDKDETLDMSICMMLKQQGLAFKIEKHIHNYPHCWRTDKPILYYPLDSWFIKSTACKDRMMELNKTIKWKPTSTGTGRFGKWLENLNDWNLSRSRYWGTPLPIWRSDSGEEKCIGSIQELYDEIEKSVAAGVMNSNPLKEKGFIPGDYSASNYDKIDLHRPYVDDLLLVSDTGKPMKRELDLIDVWFDSGSMPYAQMHYPFENKDLIDSHKTYPADFISEGVDQTRGWFFTLHAIGTMIFDSVAFKNVISTGLVLDKNGDKMSKTKGNVTNPFDAIEKYGSDAVRWYMITNSSPWDNLKFDEDGVGEVSRSFFGKLFQTYSFLTMYANVDNWHYSEKEVPIEQRPEIDRWILSELNSLIKNVTESFEDYEPTKAGRLIQSFVVDNVSNWHVRLSRKRFWGGEMTTDKISAYQTLYTCLETVAMLMAPIAPFYADRLYRDLTTATGRAKASSVHLVEFPACNENVIDKKLEERMELAQRISSMTLSLRKKEHIIVRQPLQCIAIPATDDYTKEQINTVSQIIRDEVNVKEIRFVEGNGVLVKRVKCNFRTMGKKFGKLMKSVSAAVSRMSQDEISTLEKNGNISLFIDEGEIVINTDDVEIYSEDIPGWTVTNDGNLTVALDLNIDENLRQEGVAREIVKRVQNIRKDTGFEITDRINLSVADDERVHEAVINFRDYICSQVLADSLTLDKNIVNGTDIDMEGYTIQIKVEKLIK
jgi:isoleucyl-tRNA synthetase